MQTQLASKTGESYERAKKIYSEGAFSKSVATVKISPPGLTAPLNKGDTVNLETALCAGQALGGHLVTGHVDGVGELVERRDLGGSETWSVRVPGELLRFMAEKGSLCLDGVSLTISGINEAIVQLDLIPHTLSVTTLGTAQAGARFNLEVDLIARYVERLLNNPRDISGNGT